MSDIRDERTRAADKVLNLLYDAYVANGALVTLYTPDDEDERAWGISLKVIRAAIDWLDHQGLVERKTLDDGCMLTQSGVVFCEDVGPARGAFGSRSASGDARKEIAEVTGKRPDTGKVFIIHGRNIDAKIAVEHFVRSLGLEPLDFEVVAADLGTAFVGEIVREGLERAQGIIALFTADELAFLRPDYRQARDGEEDLRRWQARQNVIFEAGMAYGSVPQRTILAVLGAEVKLFSDVKGIHLTHLTNRLDARKRLRQKLIGAKCSVDTRSDAWTDPKQSGDFESCLPPEVRTQSPFASGGPAAAEPVVGPDKADPPDDDIRMRLKAWLTHEDRFQISDRPVEFSRIDNEANVPRGSAARLIASVIEPRWREVERSTSLITLSLEPARVRDVSG